MMQNVFGLLPKKLTDSIIAMGYPAFRGKQLLQWLYEKHVYDPELMTNLPVAVRSEIGAKLDFSLPKIVKQQFSKDGTQKFALQLNDEKLVEMVLIPASKDDSDESFKNTLCISSQVGCARDCKFCATAAMGLHRNLQTHEIVGQIVLASNLIPQGKLTNLVYMGMGEPLDNLEAVLQSLNVIQAMGGLGISPRRTTISTCGIVPGIIKLADSGIKTKLAVSLNSAIDAKRSALMPINDIYPLAELKQALRYYRANSSFRITFEYIMIPGFNMEKDDVLALKKFVSDLSCKINLIPWNPVRSLPYRAPKLSEIQDFYKKCMIIDQAITLRQSRGADIDGACGQLAAKQ